MPFETVSLNGSNTDVLSETYAALREKFEAEPTGHIDFQVEGFSVFSHYAGITIRSSYVIRTATDSCYIMFVETFIKTLSPRGSNIEHLDYQVWGLGFLKHDAGRVMIRPETFVDKLAELVYAIELDFKDDKAFSNSFYVIADDRYKASAALTPGFRKALLDIRKQDYVIEINEHTFIIGNRKPISPDGATRLGELVCKLVSNQ
ncbi:hypothetical protein EOD41_07425 [Mucilaginibacter limnophilus]|uniref:Uncharacterized protein n=1 Tax=Mucilaginibacter limnophilus TaxID=1932778 RepID=A0A3S2Y4F9_9SPHI|nr:hypothetical protein [Mucilaginibacter limnophilus]RVU01779.1 hypothetical protein EOD41_07425 [Mucilaginibacter limnophilus]